MKDLDLIYCTARGLPPEERPAYLTKACGGDHGLRRRVEQMLAVADEAEAFITELPHAESEDRKRRRDLDKTPEIDLPDEVIGQKIGRYKILERVGEGGCGVVYVAEQTEPMRRRVALKVIKLGMDTKQVVARFEAERQALAMMDHPNIAKVLDGGATDNGRPYFIMELVRGIKITDYCDQASLPTKDRLDLFVPVCHAIQHAHQKGIIHRDIKPSNILVTLNDGVPVPKVIDFGIAKATEGKLTEATVYTQLHQFIGTPAYMSPEQAEMSSLDIDTRSDIYSLGVLLYELLTGKTPFDTQELMSRGIDAMRRTIREKQPVRPSTRLATLQGNELTTAAKRRAVEAPRLIHQLKGDLDWIVMKCLQKDRTRRYETANGVAADIKRHLSNEPVVARPPSKLYEFQKTVRRHKFGFVAATVVMATLAAGVVASTWQAVRAQRAERLARNSEVAAQTEAARAKEQKRIAEDNVAKAQKAEKEAAEQHKLADQETEVARQNLYYAQMHLGPNMWRGGQTSLSHLHELLDGWLPRGDMSDRRGWEWYYLNSLPYQNLRIVKEAERGVAAAALFHYTGTMPLCTLAWHLPSKRLAIGTPDGSIRIWDVAREKTTLLLQGPAPWVNYWGGTWLAWSPDGGKLAAGFADATVHVWETQAGRESKILGGPKSSVVSVAFSSDGARLAAWALRGGIKIWDINTGRLTADITHPGNVGAGAWSPDGKLLASGHGDGTATISSTNDSDNLITLRGDFAPITALAWSPDSSRLAATSSYDFTMRIWDVASEKTVLGPLRHSHEVTSLAWKPDGQKLATGSIDETIKIWNAATGKQEATLRGNSRTVTSLAWGPEDNLASGCDDGSVRIWDSIRDQESSVLPGHLPRAHSVAWSPDGKWLASGGDDGKIRIWDPPGREEVVTLKAHDPARINAQHGLIRSLAWSPDGSQLASAGLDGAAKVWQVAGGREVFELPADHGPVWTVAWSADGIHLAAGSRDGTIRVVEDLQQTSKLHVFKADERRRILTLAWSPLGERLASGGDDGIVKVWDPIRGTELARMQGHQSMVYSVAWSPDGKRLASGGADLLVITWDAETGRKLSTMHGHHGWVECVAWSPDGTRLASAGADTAVRVSDPRTGSETFVLEGYNGMFHSVSWHPDGAKLAAACSDGQIWIWDATRGFERDTTLRALPYIDRKVAAGTASAEERRWFAQSYFRAGKSKEALAAVKDDAYGLQKLARLFDEQTNTALADAARIKAITLLERQRTAEPNNEAPVIELSHLLMEANRTEEAITLLERQRTAEPDNEAPVIELSNLLMEANRTEEAVPVLAERSARNPADTILAMKVAALQAWFGHDADQTTTARRMLAWAGQSEEAEDLHRSAKLSCLRPIADAPTREAALKLARKAMEIGKNNVEWPWFSMGLGMAEYRNGHYAEALKALAAAEKSAPSTWLINGTNLITSTAGFYCSMSLFHQGRSAEARVLLTAVEAKMKPLPADDKNPLAGEANHDDLILWLACKETRALLNGSAPAANP